MSRKQQKTRRTFKVFCEGDTEYNYVDEMRKKFNLMIRIKPVNMKGGGYSSFLDALRIDGDTNCLAKFIIVDADRVKSNSGEKQNLKKLIDYCILQNKSERIPHILIVNCPNFEYVACLHSPNYKGQNEEQYIKQFFKYKNLDAFKADEKIYSVLNTRENSFEHMLEVLKKRKSFLSNEYSVNKQYFEIKVLRTIYDWNEIGGKGANIKEYFEIIRYFYKDMDK